MRAHGEGGETLDTAAAHKIWTCEPCNLLFNQRSRLHAHQHKIHNELVEHCEQCALYFECGFFIYVISKWGLQGNE